MVVVVLTHFHQSHLLCEVTSTNKDREGSSVKRCRFDLKNLRKSHVYFIGKVFFGVI